MTARVTSRDVQEIVSKLSSDKPKPREEGIKLLNTWLEGERCVSFCKYIGGKTAMLKPNEIPHAETWPFLITLLIQTISSEVHASKRRLPKLVFAKTLRIVVQRAEDGHSLLLLSVARLLFNHIWDVLKDVPSFQSEYGSILRHLLGVRQYHFHLRKRVYCGLVLLYMGKVDTSLSENSGGQSNSKEELFRCILTLHSLLDSSPGDFPDELREEIIKGFVHIFAHARDEGKIYRKLIECINTYLLKDGPNLGCQSLLIHDALQQFLFRCWTTTHDRCLKDAFVFYSRLQLNLLRDVDDGSAIIEQLLDVICKELDQISTCSTTATRSDVNKDDKCGTLTNAQCGLAELAALAFCRACLTTCKASPSEKRARKENAAAQLNDRLMKGKWLWNATLCFLVRNYSNRVRNDHFIYWFEGICGNFERIMNEANMERTYDGLLWTLRSLQGLSFVLLNPTSGSELWHTSSSIRHQLEKGWHTIWICLMHGLPMFSNISSVADAALTLLGRIISCDPMNTFNVSPDLWDLRLFKSSPSMSLLSFISCYFSKRGSHGDIRDVLHLRKNLLTTVSALLNWKEHCLLDKQMVILLPAAIVALSAGFVSVPLCEHGLFGALLLGGASGTADGFVKAAEPVLESADELFDCSVEVLSEVYSDSCAEIARPQNDQHVRLPQQIRDPLLHVMETSILDAIVNKPVEKMPLSDVLFICALLSNFMHCSYVTRLREVSPFISKIGTYMLDLLDFAVSIIEKCSSDIRCGLGSNFFDSMDSTLTSLKCFLGSPLFGDSGDDVVRYGTLYTDIVQSVERLLKATCKLYEGLSDYAKMFQSEVDLTDFSASGISAGEFHPSKDSRSMFLDMELDVNDHSRDGDPLTISGKNPHGLSPSIVNWKLDITTFMSCFFMVLPLSTWDVLFNLMEKESDPGVLENLICNLCQHPYWSSCRQFTDLVISMNKMVDRLSNLKLQSSKMLHSICGLLKKLLSFEKAVKENKITQSVKKVVEQRPSHASLELLSESGLQSLESLGDLVNKISENGLFDWLGRVELIDCICSFILLKPLIGQTMIGKLLTMLRDPDYRVRLFLARRVDVLFRTWDGHDELFQDIRSNFGVQMVGSLKEKNITAKEVLAAGQQSRPVMETTIVTLMHLSLQSEKIELEAVFMICVAAAIDPPLRELVRAVLDNLSRKLQYSTRTEYMGELVGPILFSWASCGVSLVALMEIRDFFVLNVEPINFIQYCCHWLLPALALHGDTVNLNWVAKVASQPSAALVKEHFVPAFSVSMVLHCSKKPGWEKGAAVLQSSILVIAGISEDERDNLIKKHMVSIVSHIISLASCEPDPAFPFFPKDAVVRAIQTVVDGFLDVQHSPHGLGVADKINIFRPDRVFMFLLEMHYKITAAAHYRHKCNWLSGIEVLITVIGHRAVIPSNSSYLLNIAGQFIECRALQEQCCGIISVLLKILKSKPTKETYGVLGEQLQFLVSKLVACCIPSESDSDLSGTQSTRALTLLHELTVDSDPFLYKYIKELEAFPELDMFDKIRRFHQELCHDYSAREQLLEFVKRSGYLPPRLVSCSLKALYNKLFMGSRREKNDDDDIFGHAYWHHDDEIIHAVWTLVRICSLEGTSRFGALVSDFISKIGIGDPHRVVFHLSGESTRIHVCRPLNSDIASDFSFYMETGISEDLVIAVLKLLKKYLMDDSVKIIDMTSQALRGILSTERGHHALIAFDSYERSIIEVHSKGVNSELVQKILLDLGRKFKSQAISLEKPALWKTHDKTFETWICQLVYALIGYCDDIILRLCQDIVMLKAEVAELLLPNVIVNLAGRKDLDSDLCKLIASKLEEDIFVESNKLIRSIQVFLDALNELRLCHIMDRVASSSTSVKGVNSKNAKPSTYSSRSRSTPVKSKKDSAASSTLLGTSASFWEKVYWLPIDYLVVAKSAINCGSYFTAVLYVEYWCEEHFSFLTLGSPDFSHLEILPHHIDILVSAVTKINEPDSLYGIIQSHKLTSQITTFEHEGNWSKALEYYDLQVRSEPRAEMGDFSKEVSYENSQPTVHLSLAKSEEEMKQRKPYKGLIRSLQQIGCTHVLDLYCQGLTSRKGRFQNDLEFSELQYEAAWRAGNWDFSLLYTGSDAPTSSEYVKSNHFNENLHSCLRAFQEGDVNEFQLKLNESKQELLFSIYHASEESTEYIYSTIVKLQVFYHLGLAWDLRWTPCLSERKTSCTDLQKLLSQPIVPSMDQLSWLNKEWSRILEQGQLHMNLLEPFIAFRKVLLQILSCTDCTVQHLLESASTLRKGSRFSQAAAALHEFKFLCVGMGGEHSNMYWVGRLEEAKLLRAQGQNEMAINLAKYVSENYKLNDQAADVYRLVGKWLAETRSSNSRTILDKYLKNAVGIAEDHSTIDKQSISRQSQAHFQLAHYADALFRSHEERLNSNEWQAAMRLRKHKTKELEALIKRLKSSSKGEKTDFSIKIQELQKQLTMDRDEADKLQHDRENFLGIALEGYRRCLVIGDKYDVRVVFRLVSLWFSLCTRQTVINGMLHTIKEVQSYKFIPLVYQIASRMGSSKDGQGPHSFQFALASLLKKMAIDHPYHTIFQLLALANGDRVKDKQRSRNSFVVDMDKKYAAESLLKELSTYHGDVIKQMKQMVEIYVRLAELETKREDTNRKVTLPREIRSVRRLELVPVVTSTFPVDRSCQYHEGSFPHFNGLADSVMVMNGINAPKVVECLGSDGKRYRQLAKSGNDDLRQDAVMEQFFGLVNTFLQNHRDAWKRRLGIRTYKVVPFTPSAGVLEWVNGTVPLGEYLIGSQRNGGAHGRYGIGDWSFLKCRQHMATETNKRMSFEEVCNNFRPVMHYFFLERFLHPADWFEKRLAYTRSVAATSMVGYIVGLGDRHSMNILIDQATAEVVHIDLGVAFEQGLMLKTPERVPFRLTRDIIDGMGVTGVEGVFRRCCEETLSVMRTNKEALLTIVEVFIHDPLYKWALSPLKALERQKETDDDLGASLEESQDEYEGNKDATRALLRVKQKLDGYEEGEMRSVHGQVQQLIQDAIDADRLCQMFPGWASWL